jgi:hypothetical protein
VPLGIGAVLSFMLMRLCVNRDKGSRIWLNSSAASSTST